MVTEIALDKLDECMSAILMAAVKLSWISLALKC